MSSEAVTATGDEIAASRLAQPPEDIAPREPVIEIPPCDGDAVRSLRESLGLHHVAAQVLARRGLSDPAAAQAWLDGDAVIDPEELPGAAEAADVIAAHLRSDTRIAVHGDYDVDGVCSTAIMVRALAALGADVTWHVPSRFEEGYGLAKSSIERLAGDGVGLIIAVDCGVGAVDEVAHAKSLGVEVVICDHHTIGEQLPEAPLVHPALGGYPAPFLCASAAAHKLAVLVTTRAGGDPASLDPDLALVALATVCDVVPLKGENRALVRRGVEQLRQTQRPGLRELMRVSRVDQLKVSASNLGFTLGPRINAAGRLHSAEPAVELMLTSSESRAAELAEQLAGANDRRREIEQEILFEAETQARDQRDQFAIVVAGEGWHPGVLGIVAGRLADRFNRPAIALTIDGATASGSGRAGGVYDLHGGLAACSDLLVRFGGHRAAAGLELDATRLEAFRAAFVRHAAESLSVDDLRPRLRVDALGEPADINLETVAAIEALGPFGAENPEPRLMLAGGQLVTVSKLGKTGQHYRLGVAGGGSRAQVVAFRQERVIAPVDEPRSVDLIVELQRNEYNGREEAQAVLCALIERDGADRSLLWRSAFHGALADEPTAPRGEGLDESRVEDRRGEPLSAVLVDAAAAGPAALVVNDPGAWHEAMSGFAQVAPELTLIAYDDPALTTDAFAQVVLAEPPPAPAFAAFPRSRTLLAWNEAAVSSVLATQRDLLLTREHMVTAFRTVRDGSSGGAGVLGDLESALPNARVAGRAIRALEEIGVVRVQRDGADVEAIHATDSPKTDLELSFTFRSYSEYREESEQWLRQLSAKPTER